MNTNRKNLNRHLMQLGPLVLIGAIIGVVAGISGQPVQAGPRPTSTPTVGLTVTPSPTNTPMVNPTATAKPTRPGKKTPTPTPTSTGMPPATPTPTPTSTGMPPATPTSVPVPDGVWNDVPSPNTGSPHNYLYGVAAIAPDDVWAVGGYGNLTTQAQQVIQHWNGTSWRFVDPPTLPTTYNELLAISAVSANDVWAVGCCNSGGQPLIEQWDGTSWNVVPHPNLGSGHRFFGVAAVASDDVWAVGYKDGEDGLIQTLVERWDGNSWSVVPSPNIPNQHNWLRAVTAVPGSPNELWAVGHAGPSALILHWNGTQWSLVPSPPAGSVPLLYGVVAISSNDVWAVGWTGGGGGTITLTLHWDGSSWSVVTSPNPSSTYNYLWGVTAFDTNNVWAVGDFNAMGDGQVLLLKWNGSAWTHVPGDNTGPSGVQFTLKAASALNQNDVWSVGTNSHALAEHWNGSQWSIVSAPNAGVGENVLNGVSGSASNDVWEVGYYGFGTEKRTLIEHWNGAAWSIAPSPNTNKRLNVLNGVDAISLSNVWAVGSASSGDLPDQTTLVLHWDGTNWSIIPSPSPGTAGHNELFGVSAHSANDVWAVGSRTNTGEYSKTLIEHWDGTSWSVIPSPNAPGVNNGLFGVVALAPNDVWAVGYKGVVEFETLVEHWNGSSWSIVPSPNPFSSSILSAVAASGASDIWAVGRTRNPFTFRTSTLIEHWDGNSWSLVIGFGGNGPDHALYGVAAVSPGGAWAVGDSGALALIGRWNGSSWSAFPSPNIAGRLYAATAITACDVWAVGQRYVEGIGFQTLNEHFTCN